MKTLVIKIKWGGLGDHLFHSPLPRLAKQKHGYDKVFISNHSSYNNPSTKRLVWEYNPFVDGFSNEDGPYPQFGTVPEGKNLLDAVVDFYGFPDDGERFREPEIYYKPNIILELQDATIFEPNHSNAYGIPTQEETKNYFVNSKVAITHQMKSLYGKSTVEGRQELSTDGLEGFCDVIYSCKTMFCFTTGAPTLAAALGKPVTVLFVDGVNPMFHHSKLHKYVNIQKFNG